MIVVPTVAMTNASGSRAAICWQALQPVQCAGTSSDGERIAGPAEGTAAYTLAAIKDWTFLLGPGWVVGWGNGLILGYLMYRSGLVPPRAAWLGLIGGPLIIVTGTAIMLTGNQPSDTLRALQGILTIPEFLWELFLGLYCTFRGFRASSPILQAEAGGDRAVTKPA